jgi:hypothetical protein
MAERKSFLMRIDPALWTELEAWAEADLRSVNGQVEYLLRQAVQKRKGGAEVQRDSSGTTGDNAEKTKVNRPG